MYVGDGVLVEVHILALGLILFVLLHVVLLRRTLPSVPDTSPSVLRTGTGVKGDPRVHGLGSKEEEVPGPEVRGSELCGRNSSPGSGDRNGGGKATVSIPLAVCDGSGCLFR